MVKLLFLEPSLVNVKRPKFYKKPLKNIALHGFFFYLFLLLLPTQVGKHFWPSFSTVLGIRIDYLSPTLYLTDIFVLGIVFFWVATVIKKIYKHYSSSPSVGGELKSSLIVLDYARIRKIAILVFLGIFCLVNSYFAHNQILAVYKWIKFFEFALLGFYITKKIKVLDALVMKLFAISLIFSSLLAWLQFLKQGSIGGVLYWLGERTFNTSTPFIANASLYGRLILRPYATFPHPNVLAGYLLVVLLLVLVKPLKMGHLASMFVMATILLTLSRSAIIVGTMLTILTVVQLFKSNSFPRFLKSKDLVWMTSFASLGIIFFFQLLVPRFASFMTDPEAIQVRLELQAMAFEMVRHNLLLGVGLGNFIPSIPEYISRPAIVVDLQPVHNIYLLIAAETGVVGLSFFLGFIVLTLRRLFQTRTYPPLRLSFIGILILGFFDHYFLTIQQTQLLFAIIVGIIWRRDE